jgi:tetratricopeptide (TPR) repeat protein
MATAPSPSSRWLFGPVPDLLLGCGLLYAAVFVLFAVSGSWYRSIEPGFVAPLLALSVSMPHYGATLVRVYEHRGDRRGYAIFAVWLTLAIFAWFVAGQHHTLAGSVLVTVYFTWSPWHYTGQNYGLAVLFLRRRGVPLPEGTKRWLYASFVASYALTFAVIHESSGWAAARALPTTEGIHFIPLGTPGGLVPLAAAVCAAALVVSTLLLLRGGRLRDLLPTLCLQLTQALWFSLPYAARHWGLFPGIEPLSPTRQTYFLMWIVAGHSVQYLWVTTYYARASKGWHGTLPYLAKTAAAGAAIWTLPVILFAQPVLGGVSYDAGLALLVAAAVNVHHFVLDGAIWKLRHSRVSQVLIRSREPGAEAAERAGGGWPRRLAWTAAGTCALVAIATFAVQQFALPRALASGDVDRAALLLDGLAWVGRDASDSRVELGYARIEQGDLDGALREFARSNELLPNVPALGGTATILAHRGTPEQALAATERLLAHAPEDPEVLAFAASFFAGVGQTGRARELSARAERIAAAVPVEDPGIPPGY